MRRSIICCSYLALCFSLSFLLNGASANAGDVMPPGYCELFPAADRAPLETDGISALTFKLAATTPVSTPRPKPAPWQLIYVAKSNRTWNFQYQPAAKPKAKQIQMIAFWHEFRVHFRLAPAKVVPVRSQRKHIAPVLFWGSDSIADMTLVMHLISMEAHAIVHTCITPIERIPHRMARIFEDCFRPVY